MDFEVIKLLLNHLPDTEFYKEPCWQYCWDELDDDAQEEVKNARRKALEYIDEIITRENIINGTL